MLAQLYIKNVAVIHKAAVDFSGGLNVFTGETGAGKTILISAIEMVLGERTSREIIRTGEEKAFVSALFEDISPGVAAKLSELGFADDAGSLLITREISQSGKNVCKIGGMPATSALLKEISSELLSIHGQHDSAQLLNSESHMKLIDLFGGYSLEPYRAAYGQMRQIEAELSGLNMDEAAKAQRMDMLTFQLKEIEDADLSDPEEEDALTARKRLIKNSEKILGALSQAYDALTGTENAEGIERLFAELTGGMAAAAEFLPQFEQTSARVDEMGYELADVSAELRSFLDDFEYDPRELDRIESRLDVIYRLKRKYGSTVAEIISFGERAAGELQNISTGDERAKKLEAQLLKAREEAAGLAKELSAARERAAARFTAMVEEELKFLDMPNVKLSVARTEKPLSDTGADGLEFMIVTNVGEEAKPLSKIASGGETARLMLAIKNVCAEQDDVATLIFDEVDSGVSGRAAQKIGNKLSQVARSRQVICVTHLAQVAAFADHHLLIRKDVEDGRTFTSVNALDKTRAIEELARITSGELITESSLNSARELWEHAHKTQLTVDS